jgi:hypothetical protein
MENVASTENLQKIDIITSLKITIRSFVQIVRKFLKIVNFLKVLLP